MKSLRGLIVTTVVAGAVIALMFSFLNVYNRYRDLASVASEVDQLVKVVKSSTYTLKNGSLIFKNGELDIPGNRLIKDKGVYNFSHIKIQFKQPKSIRIENKLPSSLINNKILIIYSYKIDKQVYRNFIVAGGGLK